MNKMKLAFKFFVLLLIMAVSMMGLRAQNVSGVYQTDFNEMTLQQNGSQVTGTYKYADGRIEGTVSGNTMTGWWYQNNGKGRFIFVFNGDFSAYTGKWGHDNAEPTGVWNGRKTSGFSSSVSQPQPISSVAGSYDTDFKEMTLSQNGTSVNGSYKHDNGRIEGTLNGNVLTGWWYQSSSKGRLVFVFNSDFSAFSGKWSYDNAEPSSAWNGKRIGASNTSQSYTTPSAPATTPVSLPALEGVEIFNNWNKGGVGNNPSGATYFYISAPITITRITNYHWNNGRGSVPGQISLRGQDGRTYGPWNSVGTSGTGGAQNVNWIVVPNISLQPGLYQVNDSDQATWSNNSGSFGCGFTSIYGK